MNSLKLIFGVVLLSIIISACRSNPVSVKTSQNNDISLLGKWSWKNSSGGITGQILNPPPGTYLFKCFSSDGNYFEYTNDTLKYSTHYFVKKNKTIYSVDSLNIVSFQDISRNAEVILKLTKDSLVTGDNYFDGFISIYTKVIP